MVTRKRILNGFSLLEACVVMLILSIFIAVMANVIPQKAKKKVSSEAHGRFECYYKADGTLYQQTFTGNLGSGEAVATETVDTKPACKFQPPFYAKYIIIDAVGGGAGGGTSVGGGEGGFVSSFYTSISKSYMIVPGKGGAVNNNGEPTLIKSGSSTLLTANGGKSKSSLDNTTVDDILSCVVTDYTTDSYYDCKTSPTCEIVDGKVRVSFCRTKDNYKTVDLTYKAYDSSGKLITDNPRYIVNDVTVGGGHKITEQSSATNVWKYHDISLFSDYSDATNPIYQAGWVPDVNDIWTPSLYTLEITMDIDVNEASPESSSTSNLERYIESMKYTSPISTVHPGQGGAANTAGTAGAVIILW